MLNFAKRGENYRITIDEQYLTLCDPLRVQAGELVKLASGQWEICPVYVETCFGKTVLEGWWLTNLDACDAASEKSFARTVHVATDTGLIALVEDSFTWEERQEDLRDLEGDFGAGADWLAINVSWEGSYTFTAEINKDREIIALTL